MPFVITLVGMIFEILIVATIPDKTISIPMIFGTGFFTIVFFIISIQLNKIKT
jgi:hypothetical protein